jgi:hypothetical protein
MTKYLMISLPKIPYIHIYVCVYVCVAMLSSARIKSDLMTGGLRTSVGGH